MRQEQVTTSSGSPEALTLQVRFFVGEASEDGSDVRPYDLLQGMDRGGGPTLGRQVYRMSADAGCGAKGELVRKRRHWTSSLEAYSARCPAKEGITGVHYIMDDEVVTMAHSFGYV